VDTYDTPETTIYTGINSSLFYSARSLGLKKNFAAGLPPLPNVCVNPNATELSIGAACCLQEEYKVRQTLGLRAQWDFFAGLTNASATYEPPTRNLGGMGGLLVHTPAQWLHPNRGIRLSNASLNGSLTDPLVSEHTVNSSLLWTSTTDFTLELWLKTDSVSQRGIIASFHDPVVFPAGTNLTHCGPGSPRGLCQQMLVVSQDDNALRVQMGCSSGTGCFDQDIVDVFTTGAAASYNINFMHHLVSETLDLL
jgi:hypothetical protein